MDNNKSWNVVDRYYLLEERDIIYSLFSLKKEVLQTMSNDSGNDKAIHGEMKDRLVNLRSKINFFLERVIDICSFSPMHLSSYQHLVWSLHDEANFKYKTIYTMLKQILSNVLFHHHKALWNPVTIDSQNESTLSLPLKYQVGDSQGQLFDNNVATKSLSGPDRLKISAVSYYLNESLSMFGLQEAKILDVNPKRNYFAQILRWVSQNKKLNVENELEMQWTLFVLTLSNFISSNNDYERFLSIKRNSSSLVLIETFVKSCEDIRIKNTFTQQLISAILQLLCKDDNFNKGLVETDTVIAKSSVFIGLLRFHLMLPSSPLDPSEEILYKINANNSRMEKIKQEITVIVAHRKIWNGCDVNNIDKIEELKILHLELVSLKEKTLELKKILFIDLVVNKPLRLFIASYTMVQILFLVKLRSCRL